jgi:GntR family transcriptional regulator, transcriptional repressor for pyruvate dehydrogenase complex
VSLKRANLPSTIAERLRTQILAGEVQPGDRLPGHRELAAMFSVSVGSVREAVSMLISTGLVEVRAGRGTFVAAPGPAVDGGPQDSPRGRREAEELIEARELLELQIVGMAAERASGEQLAELRNAVERMRRAAGDPLAYPEADVEFHLLLAAAAQNRFLERAVRDIRALLRRDMELSARAAIDRFGTLDFSVESHARLVSAIERGDAEAARQELLAIMDRHHGFVLGLHGLAPATAAAEAT